MKDHLNFHDLDEEYLLFPGGTIMIFPGLWGIPCLGSVTGRNEIGGDKASWGIRIYLEEEITLRKPWGMSKGSLDVRHRGNSVHFFRMIQRYPMVETIPKFTQLRINDINPY